MTFFVKEVRVNLQAPIERSESARSSRWVVRVFLCWGSLFCACFVTQDLGSRCASGACDGGGIADSSAPIDANPRGDASPGAACSHAFDCPDDQLCVATDGVARCVLLCTATAQCSSGLECSSIAGTSRGGCQPPVDWESPDDVTSSAVPCLDDAECGRVQSAQVCVTYLGSRFCSAVCDEERDCAPSSVDGVAFDFLTCTPDPGDSSRDVCLPDPRCIANFFECLGSGG